jgi:hypothetical protein
MMVVVLCHWADHHHLHASLRANQPAGMHTIVGLVQVPHAHSTQTVGQWDSVGSNLPSASTAHRRLM